MLLSGLEAETPCQRQRVENPTERLGLVRTKLYHDKTFLKEKGLTDRERGGEMRR